MGIYMSIVYMIVFTIIKAVIILTVKLSECPIFGIHEITECRMARVKKLNILEWLVYKFQHKIKNGNRWQYAV